MSRRRQDCARPPIFASIGPTDIREVEESRLRLPRMGRQALWIWAWRVRILGGISWNRGLRLIWRRRFSTAYYEVHTSRWKRGFRESIRFGG